MTSDEIKAAQSLCDAATRGPWTFIEDRHGCIEHMDGNDKACVLMPAPCGDMNSELIIDPAGEE